MFNNYWFFIAKRLQFLAPRLINKNLSFGGFDESVRVAGILAAVFAAASVRNFSAFRQVDGIIETSAVTAGASAAVVQDVIFQKDFFLSQLLYSLIQFSFNPK
jgi:hypothetical protein